MFFGNESTTCIFVSSSPTLKKVTGKYFMKKEPTELNFEKKINDLRILFGGKLRNAIVQFNGKSSSDDYFEPTVSASITKNPESGPHTIPTLALGYFLNVRFTPDTSADAPQLRPPECFLDR